MLFHATVQCLKVVESPILLNINKMYFGSLLSLAYKLIDHIPTLVS